MEMNGESSEGRVGKGDCAVQQVRLGGVEKAPSFLKPFRIGKPSTQRDRKEERGLSSRGKPRRAGIGKERLVEQLLPQSDTVVRGFWL
eukprot:scaffold4342_cov68-Cylindrotheca_fusiformis.AAC.4